MSEVCEHRMAGACHQCAIRRIAELEAENARLRDLGYGVERERDEARAQLDEQYQVLEGVRTMRDEARAACAAKDEALRLHDPRNSTERYERIADAFYDKHHRMAPGQSRPMEMGSDPDPNETQRLWRAFCNEWHEAFFDAALSSTAGSELLTELKRKDEALEKINAIRNSIVGTATINWSEHIYPLVAALDEAGCRGQPYPEAREYFGSLLARLEKAEADAQTWSRAHADALKAADATCGEYQAQLEAMRTALERFGRHQGVCAARTQVPCTCGLSEALLPSAPRLYRNAVLEEAAKVAEENHCSFCAVKIRALKTEDGT